LREREPRPYLDNRELFVKVRAKLAVAPPGIFFPRMFKKQAVDFEIKKRDRQGFTPGLTEGTRRKKSI